MVCCRCRGRGAKPGRTVASGVYDDAAGSEEVVVVAGRDGQDGDGDRMIGAINRAVPDEAGVACRDGRIAAPGWPTRPFRRLARCGSGRWARGRG